VIATAQTLVFLALYLVVFVLSAWALVDAAIRPAAAFVNAGKRTKNFWLLVTGIAAAISFIALPPLNAGGFLVIAAAVAAGVYLADVRPAVRPYSGGRGGRGRGTPPSRGGW
jgi:Protein of unknown function (DUF2516)